MSIDWLDQNSGGSGGPGVYFDKVGAKVVGEIITLPRKVDTEYGERLVIELRAAEGCTASKGKMGADGPIAVGDEVSLWVKSGFMASAVRDAVRAVNGAGLAVGDTIAVAYSEDKETGKPQPAKVYQARYTPAKAAVSVDNLV
jgi:hypothetical protein